MPHRHLCPTAGPFEGHGHEHFQREVRAHAVVRSRHHAPFLVGNAVSHDEPLQRDDLAVDASAPVVLAVRRPHAAEIFSAYAEIYLAHRRGKVFRSPPAHYALRLRPCLPEKLARRVENTGDDQFLCHRFRGWSIFCQCCHGSPPFSTRKNRDQRLNHGRPRRTRPNYFFPIACACTIPSVHKGQILSLINSIAPDFTAVNDAFIRIPRTQILRLQ